METEINLPFVTADASRPQAPRPEAHAAPSSSSWSTTCSQKSMGPVQPVPEGRRRRAQGHRRGRAGGRHDPHAEDPAAGEGVLRQGAAQGREPRRGGRDRRRHPGRRPVRRREGRAAARRDAAVAGHRDPGRRDDQAHRAQHHHPHQEDARSSRPRPTASPRSRSTSCRASARWRGTTARWASSSSIGHPARAARRAADRGHVRHRRQRHPERVRQGPRPPGKTQNITITASSGLAKDEVERMVQRGRRRTPTRTRSGASWWTCATRPTRWPTTSRRLLEGQPREGRRRPGARRSRRRSPRPRKAAEGEDARRAQAGAWSASPTLEPQAGGVARTRRRGGPTPRAGGPGATPARGPGRARGIDADAGAVEADGRRACDAEYDASKD